jgi:hypothetical protein
MKKILLRTEREALGLKKLKKENLNASKGIKKKQEIPKNYATSIQHIKALLSSSVENPTKN